MANCNCNDLENIILNADENECPAVGYQQADVCVQVTVTPYATPGTAVTTCCGDPVVTAGDVPCGGKRKGSCTFTMTQTVCVAVPVAFGAVATVGDTYVDCLGASSEDICTDCTPPV